MRRATQRWVIVISLFVIWIGAAALACRPFVSAPIAEDHPRTAASPSIKTPADDSSAQLAAEIQH